MQKISFYIGSNSETHELEKGKALDILEREYEGMTISELFGYWEGNSEKTLLVQVVMDQVDYTQVKRVSRAICADLKQDAVMIEITESNTLFIGK